MNTFAIGSLPVHFSVAKLFNFRWQYTDGYSSKLSLYDFIAMLMPGSIIVGVMMVLVNCDTVVFPDNRIQETFFIIFFFIASYLAGIINHIATSNLFALIQFKNCRLMLMNSRKQAKRKNYRTIHSESRICHKSQNQHFSSSRLVDEYYREYYYVKKEGYGNDIEVMEGQVAFLQSLILPLLLILCTQLCHSKNLLSIFGIDYTIINECFVPVIFLILIAVVVSIFSRQQKIYDRVWEDYHYLKKFYEEVKDEKRPCQ